MFMHDKVLKVGDYILITDMREDERYLKIGVITDIEYYPDGDVEKYTVRFGYKYDTSCEDLAWYSYNLTEMCRVLQFADR